MVPEFINVGKKQDAPGSLFRPPGASRRSLVAPAWTTESPDLQQVDVDLDEVGTRAPRDAREGHGHTVAGDVALVVRAVAHGEPDAIAVDVLLARRPVPVDVEGAVQDERVAVDDDEVAAELARAVGVAGAGPVRIVVPVGVDGPVADPELPLVGGERVLGRDADLDGVAGVRGTVAVVVHQVEADLRRVRVHRRVRVVAVRAAGGLAVEAVAVRVRAGRGDLVAARAVLVDAVVHDLAGAGVDGAVPVVAILGVVDAARGDGARPGGVGLVAAVAVAIDVRPALHAGDSEDVVVLVIVVAVAVVVIAVADLGGARVDGAVAVVAVLGVVDVALGLAAGQDDVGDVAVAVAVTVLVEGGAALEVVVRGVDGAVAVVVEAVADLGGGGVHVRVGVLAVTIDEGVAVRAAGHEGLAVNTVAVAVSVRVDDEVGGGHAGVAVVAVLGEHGGLVDLDVLGGQRAGDEAEAAVGEGVTAVDVEGAIDVRVLAPGLGAREIGVAGVEADRELEAVLDGRPGGQRLGRGLGAVRPLDDVGVDDGGAGGEEEGQEPEGSGGTGHGGSEATFAVATGFAGDTSPHLAMCRSVIQIMRRVPRCSGPMLAKIANIRANIGPVQDSEP